MKKSSLDIVIMDFMKYIPKPKRNDYELILRRCNFSDTNDPIFPVMLFLLFLQDNLADGTENLAAEVKSLKTRLESERLPDSPKKSSRWKFIITILLAVQILLSVFCLFKTTGLPPQNFAPVNSGPGIGEIQKLNFYWDLKLEQLKNERHTMNNLFSENSFYIAILITLLVLVVILICDIIMIRNLTRLIRLDQQHQEAHRHDFKELCNITEGEELLAEAEGRPQS